MDHWSSYWRAQGAQGQPAPAYRETLNSIWTQLCAEIGTKASILDVGTGNGSLAVLMAQYAAEHERDWKISALDAAEVQLPETVPESLRQAIDLYSETSAEELPFADGTFDVVVSQFAVEYGQMEQIIRECLRVLKPGGRLEIIAHCADSGLVRGSEATDRLLKSALEDNGLFDCAERLVKKVQPILAAQGVMGLRADPEAGQLQNAYNQATYRVQASVKSKALVPHAEEILGGVFSVIQSCAQSPLAPLLDELNRQRENHAASHQRALDQINAAKAGEKMEASLKAIGGTDVSISATPVHWQNDLIGQHFSLKR